jgi:hypothetical protein
VKGCFFPLSFQNVADRLRRPFVAADAGVAAGDAVLQVRVRFTKSATGLELLDRTQVVIRAAVARRWLRPKSDLCRHWVHARLAEVLHDGVRLQLPYPSSGTRARELCVAYSFAAFALATSSLGRKMEKRRLGKMEKQLSASLRNWIRKVLRQSITTDSCFSRWTDYSQNED